MSRRNQKPPPLLYRCPRTGGLSLAPEEGLEAIDPTEGTQKLEGSVEIHIFESREGMLGFLQKTGDNTPGLLHMDTAIDEDGNPAAILTKKPGKETRPTVALIRHRSRKR